MWCDGYRKRRTRQARFEFEFEFFTFLIFARAKNEWKYMRSRSPLMYDNITIPSVPTVFLCYDFFFGVSLFFVFCGRPYCVIETKRIFCFRKSISSKGCGMIETDPPKMSVANNDDSNNGKCEGDCKQMVYFRFIELKWTLSALDARA